jgi:hypothetical protein
MLGTIGFDNQPVFQVHEIGDVPTQYLLPSKLEAAQTPRTQDRP